MAHKTQKNLVSVAMCTYCGAPFLREQLESISRQTFKPFEIVIIDDASTDDSVRIIKNFSTSANIPVRLTENDNNLGIIHSFGKAIGLCRGDIIFLADQDDVWEPEKIKFHMEAYASHPHCGYVFSDAELTDKNLQIKDQRLYVAVRFSGKRYNAFTNGEQLSVMLKGGNFAYGTTMSFRASYRDILLPINSSTSACTHDVWISYILSSIGAYGIALPQALVRYRQHSNNQAGAGRKVTFSGRIQSIIRPKAKEARDWIEAYKNMTDRIRNSTNSQVIRSLQELEFIIRHLTVRGNLSGKKGLSRYICLITEALSGRYEKYSSGWKSFVKDIFFQNE